jgi:hypothetical protein
MQQEKIWDFFQGDGISSFDGSYSRLTFLSKSQGWKINTKYRCWEWIPGKNLDY